jgi:hypothetical protein
VAPSIRKKLAITSPTSGGRSVGIVRSPTQTMEFSFSFSLASLFIVPFFLTAKLVSYSVEITTKVATQR